MKHQALFSLKDKVKKKKKKKSIKTSSAAILLGSLRRIFCFGSIWRTNTCIENRKQYQGTLLILTCEK